MRGKLFLTWLGITGGVVLVRMKKDATRKDAGHENRTRQLREEM